MTRHPFRSLAALLLAILLAGALVSPAQAAPQERYRNPISRSFADTFADPAVIQAKDGWWYAYSTADPLRAGDEPGIMHIARTRNFVDWQYMGTVFDESNRPSWATATSGLWAPDVRYVNGQYVIYFTVTDTTLNAGDDSAIGVATSPSPVGPWTPTDEPVIDPRPAPGDGFYWTFDPAMFTDVDGQSYLYYGSYFGGVYVTKLSRDGLRARGSATQVAINDRYEGSYVVRHEGWYYFMGSSANCCAGPATGYSVFSGRSRSPLGPFVDADGFKLNESRVGGTILVTQNGNRWIGAGHHAIATDASGRDHIVYHALDRNKPWLTEPFGINRRPMLLDRIDWIDGWPRTRAGAGPSEGPQPAPVTGSAYGINDANPAARGFLGLTARAGDPQAGSTGLLRGTARTRANIDTRRVRIRLDLSSNRPLILTLGDARRGVAVTVDPDRDRLVLTAIQGGRTWRDTTPLRREGRSWRTLIVELNGSRALAQLSESDLNDPYAEVSLRLPGRVAADGPLRFASQRALIDNVTIRPLATEARRLVRQPQAGRLLISEEFNGPLSGNWDWVRRDPAATVSNGRLSWPVQAADLVGTGNNAGVLLRDTPNGNWIAETKLTLDLGIDTVRNFQQAGIIAYENDDDFARLSSVAIWNTRQTEFGREVDATPHDASDDRTSFGGAIIGTPAPTMWLRLAHTRNRAGEHLYRAGISRDGRDWTWGAVWTFRADTMPRIGLIAHGLRTDVENNTPAVARFDYLRFYRSSWTGPTG
jgi:arabinan endo-1,5-alpha-L-arabinosidase